MKEYGGDRSLTAYVLISIACIGLLIALAGIVTGSSWLALAGGLILLLALLSYQGRATREP